ncbi:putative beta-lysine N-acetyltransferase [Gracilibacillus caseinilyticus]|uniref:Beta-lysine N-acetyltransferase n=1 Tax=Gracilibacillus caseinilyticus TaxID=2932256 RepID=A0ABY4EYX4_9BACI|nr:putative beta-lysine N-acetyltransferase [Gracilibacillus caseinilyticus]UOQ49052.1 putative beta-lysine N-acetyltransferase [Gracilibacillus caseinilyticus]
MKSLLRLNNGISLSKENLHIEPVNQRVKVYDLPKSQYVDYLIEYLIKKGLENRCDKLIFFAKREQTTLMEDRFFEFEGIIKGFFNGKDAYIYALFLDDNQSVKEEAGLEKNIIEATTRASVLTEKNICQEEYKIRWAKPIDRFKMAKLYGEVFESYPTPMNDPDFILQMMKNDVYFSVAEHRGDIVSACSGDVMPAFNAAEFTDCATLEEHREKGLLLHQAIKIINLLKEKKIKTVFSYSRSVSIGMNLINAKLGFTYGGRMMRNSNIAGRLENMNIWFRNLS